MASLSREFTNICIFAIIDDRSNKEFIKLTQFHTRDIFHTPTLIYDLSVDAILRKAADTKFKYCFIQRSGHCIYEHKFLEYLSKIIISTNFFIIGHILDYKEDYCGLHTQCLLVNLDYYRKFNKPAFGRTKQLEPINLPVPIRSKKDIHDNYTPYWLRTSGKYKKYIPMYEGWNFINISLRNNLTIFNWASPLRALKKYYYPNKTSRDTILKDCELYDKHYPVFYYNTEFINSKSLYKDKINIKHLYCVAAGLKPNVLLRIFNFNKDTTITYFDFSKNSLFMKEYIRNNWNGSDYIDFIQDVRNKFNMLELDNHTKIKNIASINKQWAHILSFWDNDISLFKKDWNIYKHLPHRYIHCNVVTNPYPLLKYINCEPESVIWWSNVFFTHYSCYNIEFKLQKNMKDIYQKWITELNKCNPNLLIFGRDYEGKSADDQLIKNYVVS